MQRAVEHLHRCGPRAVAEFLAEILDRQGVDSAALDLLLEWRRLDPATVRLAGGDRFPPSVADAVPADLRRRAG